MTTASTNPRSLLRIGEVAAQSGVSVQALRYYERRGLLRSATRRASGYREFDPDTVRLVRFVKQAQELGFTLEELEELLRLRKHVAESRRGAGTSVRAAIAAKLEAVDLKMRQLQAMRDALAELIAICDRSCLNGTAVADCPIFEAIDAGVGGASRTNASPAGEHKARRPTSPQPSRVRHSS